MLHSKPRMFSSDFDSRRSEADRMRQKYPDRIPVWLESHESADNALPPLDKKKFLVPVDFTLGQFIYVIRGRMKLKQEQALFLMVNNALVPNTSTLGQLYNEHKSQDGFLYLTVTAENTFGYTTFLPLD